jgi:hypothetical protein
MYGLRNVETVCIYIYLLITLLKMFRKSNQTYFFVRVQIKIKRCASRPRYRRCGVICKTEGGV